MDLKAFEWIQNGLYEELSKQGFSEPQPLEDPAGKLVMYTAADVAYGLLYDVKKQRFELRSTTLKDGEPGTWRSLSLWLYDEREGTRADMESILNDFVEVVQGPKRVAVVQQKRRGKDGERTVDPLFFMNRLVNIFPELKDELNQEKIAYGQVRYVTFVKSHVVPRLSLIHIYITPKRPVRPRPDQRDLVPPWVPLFQGAGAEFPYQPRSVPPDGG